MDLQYTVALILIILLLKWNDYNLLFYFLITFSFLNNFFIIYLASWRRWVIFYIFIVNFYINLFIINSYFFFKSRLRLYIRHLDIVHQDNFKNLIIFFKVEISKLQTHFYLIFFFFFKDYY